MNHKITRAVDVEGDVFWEGGHLTKAEVEYAFGSGATYQHMAAISAEDMLRMELMIMMVEEAGEVVQATTKALRHGLDNHHPKVPDVTNQQAMQNELADVAAVVSLLGEAGVQVKPDPQQITWAVKAKRHWMRSAMMSKGEIK